MKAGVLYGNEDIRYEEIPTPEIGRGEVLVRVAMTGICGSDLPRVLDGGAHYYPIVLGHEFSGTVVQIGEGVDRVSVGDRVAGVPLVPCMTCADCQRGNYSLCRHYTFIGSRVQGAFAEYVKLPERNVVPFGQEVSFEQGAFFEPSTVALHGLRCAGYVGGRDVAVVGCGTIGLFTLQWAKIFGARSVTAFDVSDARLALAKKLGADFVCREPDGRQFDFVLETAGQPDAIKTCFAIAANKASICCIGTPHRNVNFTAREWETMNRKEFTLTGSWMSYSAPFPGEEWELTAHYFGTGQLRYDEDMIFRKMPLSRINEAFALYKTPGQVQGKIMICCE